MNIDPVSFNSPFLRTDGKPITFWQNWLTALRQIIFNLPTTFGATTGAYTDAPASPSAGQMYFVGAPYYHMVVWDGTSWQFADDGANRFEWRPSTLNGRQACNGTATSYLVCGATLSIANFTTPNVNGSNVYAKSGAAYTGTINSPVAPTFAGAAAVSSGLQGGGPGFSVFFPYTPSGTITATGEPKNIIVPMYFRR